MTGATRGPRARRSRGIGPDVAWAVALGALALGLRWIDPGGMALDHYDEGAYATSAQAVARGRYDELHPLQHFLSPPLHFGLAGLASRITGLGADACLLALGVLFGALTAPLVYVLTRTAAGRAPAAAAGVLVALASHPVAFSRTGLTDALFVFLFLASFLPWRLAGKQGGLASAAVTGLLVGLAWNTKYHGWLVLVVLALGSLPRLVRGSPAERGRVALRLLVGGLVAGALYVPWFLYVQGLEGGYARLAAEHGRYLTESFDWLGHVARHAAIQLHLEGALGALAVPAALVVAAWADPVGREDGVRRWVASGLAVPLYLLACSVGTLPIAGGLAVWALASPRRGRLPRELVLAWAVFSVLTPLYHVYARLLLPWAVLTAWMAGFGCDTVLEALEPRVRAAPRRWALGAAALLLATGSLAALVGFRRSFGPYAPRTGLRDAARAISRELPVDSSTLVLGEPVVVHHLRAAGLDARHVVEPEEIEQALEEAGELYLVVGRYGRWTGAQARWQARSPGSLVELSRHAARVGDVRLLDDAPPWEARRLREDPEGRYDLVVFRVRP